MKKLLALAVMASVLFFGPAPQASAVSYDVIGVGDSIGKAVFPYVATQHTRWLNGEASRAPEVSGVPPSRTCNVTCTDSTLNASAITALTWAISSSKPGGYVIVQEGGMGDKNGTYLTLAEWVSFVEKVIEIVPDDRTLVFIYPAYDPSFVTQYNAMYSRTVAAKGVLEEHKEQPYITINWWNAVRVNHLGSPTPYVQADGLHPSWAGILWLSSQMSEAVS